MRVMVLGGTRFIGRAVVDELVAAGHDVLVVHRGRSEPPGLPDVPHVHADRTALGEVRGELDRFGPEAVLDCAALGAPDSDAVLAALPDHDLRLAVLSSCDVYRAYGGLHRNQPTDPLPLQEDAPLRPERYPYRGQMPGMDDYEKQDVEERFLARGATVLRLPMVYGPRDYQRREWFVLRRVRAGRRRIPIGAATGAFSRGFVTDIARGVRLALEHPGAAGEVYNLAERRTPSMALLARWILEAAGATDVELVTVPDEALPPDLRLTGAVAQSLIIDSHKARTALGYTDTDVAEALSATVGWHLENPPEDGGAGFDADDQALAAADASSGATAPA